MLKQIYLDHNATTQLEQSAQSALLFFSSQEKQFGNPSSIHWAGRLAKQVLDKSRDQLADSIKLEDPGEIVFTSSATESINTILKGFYFSHTQRGKKVCIITTAVEHDATLETVQYLSSLGAQIEILTVNAQGHFSIDELESILKRCQGESTLVSLMAANNETGVIFPWEQCSILAKQYGASVHIDAVQALGKIENFSLPPEVDFASFSGHKIGALKGVGALVVRKGNKLEALLHGGAQERKRRAGTENIVGILTFGAAAQALKNKTISSSLRDYFEEQVGSRISGSHIHGSDVKRLWNTSNILFDQVRGESLIMGLDLEGFAVSSGSACNSGSILPSHVLLAMGRNKEEAKSALRVSLSAQNTKEEIDAFLDALVKVVQRIRAASK